MKLLNLMIVILVAGCASASHDAVSNTRTLPRFEEVSVDDQEFPVPAPGAFAALRGYLVVAEDRSSPQARPIKLPVVVIKARNSSGEQKKPPVLRLAGGPGLSGLSAAAYPGAYPWTDDRDFIILAQRGTQNTRPGLLCPEYLEALINDENSLALKIEAARKCRERYGEAGVSLSAYHSAASAADIEALRRLLGEEKLSLYGGSYGTRLALTYARDYPDRVASMVLDSPLPHTVSYDDESPGNFRDALKKVADTCADDQRCAQGFPQLFGRFQNALERARQEPWLVERADGEITPLTDRDLALLIEIGSSAGISDAPRLMDAVARRNKSVIAPLLERQGESTAFAWGMRLSVWCSEAAPFSKRSEREPSAAFASLDGAVVPPEVCAVWDVDKRPDREKAGTASSVPTLIIAGEYDPNTPPRWGSDVARTLENSYLAVVPFGRHSETTNWSGDGCAMAIAAAFFDDEQKFLAKPERSTQCLKSRKPPVFNMDRTDK